MGSFYEGHFVPRTAQPRTLPVIMFVPRTLHPRILLLWIFLQRTISTNNAAFEGRLRLRILHLRILWHTTFYQGSVLLRELPRDDATNKVRPSSYRRRNLCFASKKDAEPRSVRLLRTCFYWAAHSCLILGCAVLFFFNGAVLHLVKASFPGRLVKNVHMGLNKDLLYIYIYIW